MQTHFEPGLYIVATPIGNLMDRTERADAVLKIADSIYAEDTRQTAVLLNHIGRKGAAFSYREAAPRPAIADIDGTRSATGCRRRTARRPVR